MVGGHIDNKDSNYITNVLVPEIFIKVFSIT
jgi:hypothetical protein